MEEALFPESTLGWNIAGPREVIRTVTRDELIAYRDRYYVPGRMTIVIAGQIVPGFLPLLEKTFGRAPVPSRPADKPFEPFVAPKRLAHPIAFKTKKTEQVQLGIAFHGLPYGHPLLPATSLLATILGGTMSSRLFIQVRERRGLCYSIHAGHQPLEDTGVFSVLSGLERTRVDEAVRVIWQELQKTVRRSVGREELRRAKDHLRGKLMLAFEDSSNLADWYGKQYLFERKLETAEARLARLDRVTPRDIRTAAKRLFRKDAMAAALIGPFEHDKEFKSWFGLKDV
jgi:predicted Zn-dependent peptidase